MDRDPVGKALAVLLALADEPEGPWSIRRFARDLDTSPTTIHRIFTAFEGRNLLVRDEEGGYLPGAELFRLCRSLSDNLFPVGFSRTHIEALADESGEAALVGAYDPARREMMFIDVVQAVHPLHYDVGLYRWIPVHSGATGLAILAFLPEAERREIYRTGLTPLTAATLVAEESLEQACALTRERGYSMSVGQRLPGAVGIAAPVFDSTGDVFGDIAVTVPEQRFEPSWEEPLARGVVATAARVTEELRRAGHRRG
jgi:IclR family acetate operon transcriptional repressor